MVSEIPSYLSFMKNVLFDENLLSRELNGLMDCPVQCPPADAEWCLLDARDRSDPFKMRQNGMHDGPKIEANLDSIVRPDGQAN